MQCGGWIPPHELYAVCFLWHFHVHLPSYDLVLRLHGITPTQNDSLFRCSIGQGQVYDGYFFTFIRYQVMSGPAVTSNSQCILVYDLFPECGNTLFCAPWVPVLAVGIDVSHNHHATSPLRKDLLPAQSPPCSISGLRYSLITILYNAYHLISPSIAVDEN